jgi:hypothetical protein
MHLNTLPVTEILDTFDECNNSLIFIESAVRGLVRTGNLNEDNVGDGLSIAMQTLIGEYKKLQADIQNYLSSVVLSSFDLAPIHDKDKET